MTILPGYPAGREKGPGQSPNPRPRPWPCGRFCCPGTGRTLFRPLLGPKFERACAEVMAKGP